MRKEKYADTKDGREQLKKYFKENVEPHKLKAKELQNRLNDLVQQKNMYVATMRPLTEAEYQNKMMILKQDYQTKLHSAKKKFDAETSKSELTGAYQLFKEFEELMNYKMQNLSKPLEYGDGESGTWEELIASPKEVSPKGLS